MSEGMRKTKREENIIRTSTHDYYRTVAVQEGMRKTKQEEDITRTGTHGSRHVRAGAVHEGRRHTRKRT